MIDAITLDRECEVIAAECQRYLAEQRGPSERDGLMALICVDLHRRFPEDGHRYVLGPRGDRRKLRAYVRALLACSSKSAEKCMNEDGFIWDEDAHDFVPIP